MRSCDEAVYMEIGVVFLSMRNVQVEMTTVRAEDTYLVTGWRVRGIRWRGWLEREEEIENV